MKKCLSALLVFLILTNCFKFVEGQITLQKCTLIIDTKGIVFNRTHSKIIINRFQPDSARNYRKIDSLIPLNTVLKTIIRTNQPFFSTAMLYENDSLIGMTSSFIVTNSTIKIDFNHFPVQSTVTGGENDFLSQNFYLYMAMPANIVLDNNYTMQLCKQSYELSIPKSISLQQRYNEYEKSVLRQVKERRNAYYTIYTLYSSVKSHISTKTLDSCYSCLADTLKKLPEGKKLNEYITNAKKLFLKHEVPLFTVQNENEDNISSTNFFKDHPYTLIEFWASWCAPCRAKMKDFKEQYKYIDTSQLQILAISIDDNRESWIAAINRDTITWKNYRDPLGWKGDIARIFNLNYIPDNYIIDRNGNIVARGWDKDLNFFLKSNR